MTIRGPRLEFAVGAFLLLALVSLLVLAIASTNGRFGFGFGGKQYDLSARFTQIGVKIGGVTVGRVSNIALDPLKFDSIVTLAIDSRFNEIPADTSASILTGGLLGESYISLQPGGDVEVLAPGEEIVFTSPAVDLIQMVGKFMFSGDNASSSPSPSSEGTTP